jgi:hypothetical protein
MPQWEYCKIDLNDLPRDTDVIDILNAAGEQGWELISVTSHGMGYFKRARPDAASTPAPRRKAATSGASEG